MKKKDKFSVIQRQILLFWIPLRVFLMPPIAINWQRILSRYVRQTECKRRAKVELATWKSFLMHDGDICFVSKGWWCLSWSDITHWCGKSSWKTRIDLSAVEELQMLCSVYSKHFEKLFYMHIGLGRYVYRTGKHTIKAPSKLYEYSCKKIQYVLRNAEIRVQCSRKFSKAKNFENQVIHWMKKYCLHAEFKHICMKAG